MVHLCVVSNRLTLGWIVSIDIVLVSLSKWVCTMLRSLLLCLGALQSHLRDRVFNNGREIHSLHFRWGFYLFCNMLFQPDPREDSLHRTTAVFLLDTGSSSQVLGIANFQPWAGTSCAGIDSFHRGKQKWKPELGQKTASLINSCQLQLVSSFPSLLTPVPCPLWSQSCDHSLTGRVEVCKHSPCCH